MTAVVLCVTFSYYYYNKWFYLVDRFRYFSFFFEINSMKGGHLEIIAISIQLIIVDNNYVPK